MKDRVKRWCREFFKFEIRPFILTGLIFTLGVLNGHEVVDAFMDGNPRAGMNAVTACFFIFFWLLNEQMHESMSRLYRKMSKLDTEMVKEALRTATKAVETMKKYEVIAESAQSRADDSDKRLQEVLAGQAEQEMKARKKKPVVKKKAVKKVTKKKK